MPAYVEPTIWKTCYYSQLKTEIGIKNCNEEKVSNMHYLMHTNIEVTDKMQEDQNTNMHSHISY